MIRHIVFFTAPAENLDEVRAGLSILTAIPHARLLEIGTNIKTDQLGTDVDLVVYGEFDDEAALPPTRRIPTTSAPSTSCARSAKCGWRRTRATRR